jgi:predicted MFS family arabinose efflux permease
MKGRSNLIAAAFCLTALSYGLARFAYGLLLPEIREEILLSATVAGWIGGGSFAAYCVGIIFASGLSKRLGERLIAVLAGVMSTAGMGFVSISQSALGLGCAMTVAGLSTGLTSPPLAVTVAKWIEEKARPRANGIINAGTAMGIVFSGLVVVSFPGSWRELYGVFAAIGAAVTLWLYFAVPKADVMIKRDAPALSLGNLVRRRTGSLCISAFLTGAGSTAIWTFGANIMRDDYAFSNTEVAITWVVIGVSGLFGATTGFLADKFGLRSTHRVSVSIMALTLMCFAAASMYPYLGFGVMGLFGMAYIVATGSYLLWGITLYKGSPAVGLGLPFLVLALGQTAGAPLFGAIWDLAGSNAALLSFSMVTASGMIWSARTAV